jgi:hypothetical protein
MKKVITEVVLLLIVGLFTIKAYSLCLELDCLVGTEDYSFVDHSSWSEIVLGGIFIILMLVVDIATNIKNIFKK